ncbi:MAG: hypothetical protein SW833_09080 [Cyanobacteriota bacterium]|nr:hypothetical protein [Cyanobacteriota bacterium]
MTDQLKQKLAITIEPKKVSDRQKYARFTALFLLMASLPMVAVGLFNIIIDPYGTFNSPVGKFNHEKPSKDNNDRLYKAADIMRIKPVTVILGSSRTKQSINPEHPTLQDKTPIYNLALNGANIYEVRRYLEHAIANQEDIELVVLGVDFFMFNGELDNQPSFSENRLETAMLPPNDLINSVFSLDTYQRSVETVEASRTAKTINLDYGKNGFMPNRKVNDGKTEARFDGSIKTYFKFHSNYTFSENYFEEFKKIVELCQKQGIELKVFIPPAHATDNEAIRVTGQWEAFEEWKRKMVKIVPVWDFSGYNSVVTEPIQAKMENYADNSHFTVRVGNWILDRIFSTNAATVPTDFGVLLTPDNVESHLAEIERDRETWAAQHPDEVQLVRRIYDKFIAQREKDNPS